MTHALPSLSIIQLPQLQELLRSNGFPAWRAKQVLDWRNKGILNLAEMGNVPMNIREVIQAAIGESPLTLLQRQCASDGTRKYLFSLSSGSTIETVMIPDEKRVTVCLSSQVGCVLDCPFCHTGSQKFEKNLTAAELVAQVLMVKADLIAEPLPPALSPQVTHLVYMGMGEPLANEEPLHQSLAFFLDEEGIKLSRRRITVSTSGLLPQITRLGETSPVNLAISLHSAIDAKRDRLVPINKKHPLTALRQTLDAYPLSAQRHITLEYVMLAGVNDQKDDLDALVAYVRKNRERVNLIRFNPYPGNEFSGSSTETMDEFAKSLICNGVRATVRRSRGDDIMAACGQLKSSKEE